MPLREEVTSLEICCKATVPTVEGQTDFLKLRSLWEEFVYIRIGIELLLSNRVVTKRQKNKCDGLFQTPLIYYILYIDKFNDVITVHRNIIFFRINENPRYLSFNTCLFSRIIQKRFRQFVFSLVHKRS